VATTVARTPPPALPGSTGTRRVPPWAAGATVAAALVAITTIGALLRFYAFAGVHPNPYYDAAVRSMASSWHNFFFGAAEPAAGVSVDKIPFDLWLQVASVKVFGFTSAALRLPEAVAATAAIPLLYDLVERILSPLLENACRHGVSTVEVSVRADNGAVVIDVVDDGPGVSAEDADRIFEPGIRAANSPNGDAGARAGLGLALARRLAQAARGTVTVQPGSGGRFRVRLPVA